MLSQQASECIQIDQILQVQHLQKFWDGIGLIRPALYEGLSRRHLVEGHGKEPMRWLAALYQPERRWPTRIGLPGDRDGHSCLLLSRFRLPERTAAGELRAINPAPGELPFPHTSVAYLNLGTTFSVSSRSELMTRS